MRVLFYNFLKKKLETLEHVKACQQMVKFSLSWFKKISSCIHSTFLKGKLCGVNCPCADGFTCTTNPLCQKCGLICMKNSMIDKLSFYLNEACFGNCKESVLNHLSN